MLGYMVVLGDARYVPLVTSLHLRGAASGEHQIAKRVSFRSASRNMVHGKAQGGHK